jgi:hypothetical protein
MENLIITVKPTAGRDFTPEERNRIQVFSQEEQDQMMIAEYEERKKAILSSDIPAFFGPDPSMF